MKVILFVQVSLDGFFEGPKKELDWNMVDDELHAHILEVLRPMGAFLSGRVTYELMAGYWPTADADPAATPFVKEFAPIWRDMPKVVYSKTLASAGWNTTIARDVVRDEVEELKLRGRGDLVVGGGELGRRSWRRTWSTSTGSTSTRSGSGRGAGFFRLRRRRFRCGSPRRGRSGTASSFCGTNDSGPVEGASPLTDRL